MLYAVHCYNSQRSAASPPTWALCGREMITIDCHSKNKNYTSVTLTRFFRILVGIFGLGSFVRERLLEKFRLRYFVWELSFGILRLGTFAWDLSLGNFRLGSFALKRSFGFGSFVWELSFGIFRLGTLTWDLSFGNFRLGSFARELWLGIVRFETLDTGWRKCFTAWWPL